MISIEQRKREVTRRRTFAIISHPDAGKTTLTEKFLLIGGAIRLAGSVKSRKSKKFATSDWMELEKQRGISVSTSVMNFEHAGYACNLLDTPGHQDFSEDTYRTLSAADCAIMLLDGAKGVEPQTIKLFEVCKLRRIPIFTFINKMDRFARDTFELLDEIEKVLGINTFPVTWPIGSGEDFRGVIHRHKREVHFFEGRNISTETHARIFNIDNAKEELFKAVGQDAFENALEGFDMVTTAGHTFDPDAFATGSLTPVFFGSAMTNFGVRAFLEEFLDMAPAPGPKMFADGSSIEPLADEFSGFVFKIQANMDPKHRDRIAFLRVVSGVYEPGKLVNHARLTREIKLTQPLQFFARERTGTDVAFAGDIVGIYDSGIFAIGDSLVERGQAPFDGIPSFAPENFASLTTNNSLKRKQLLKGLEQLCQEGTVQLFFDESRAASDPILGAVGELQFDVLLFRLQNEYNVDCQLVRLSYQIARWTNASDEDIEQARSRTDATIVKDADGHRLFLFKNDFHLNYFKGELPGIRLFSSNAQLLRAIRGFGEAPTEAN
jgi:peptide chain release factor 3